MNTFVHRAELEKGRLSGHFSRYDNIRKIQIPEKSRILAEFLGILFGDGHFLRSKKAYHIGITLNLTEDGFYSNYVSRMIKILFGLEPKIARRPDYGTLVLSIDSKVITRFLSGLGFRAGSKKGNLKVPDWIKSNKKYIRSFLRGVIDTDGSLFFTKRGTYKKNKYPVIEIKLHDERLIRDIGLLFDRIKFPVVLSPKDKPNKIQANGEMLLNKWVDEIGIGNLNSFSRYLVWKYFGYLEPETKLKDRLKLLGWQNQVMRIA